MRQEREWEREAEKIWRFLKNCDSSSKSPSCAAPLPSPPRHLLHLSMERTTSEISVAVVNESGGSAPPTGGHDTSIPPSVADFCDLMGFSEMARRELAALYIEYQPTRDQLARIRLHTKPEGIDPGAFFVTYDADSAEAARRARRSRKLEVERFTTQYVYGNNSMEQRHCVWTEDSCLWPEKSSGIMWVGVHGADSVCVVTRRGVLDTTLLRGNLKPTTVEIVLSIFRKSIICEIEDLADPSSELRQRFQQSIKKPFGVVSANPGTNNIHKESGHEASSAEYDEKKAIEFLKEKMKCDTNFTVTETTKTAICAFQHLFRKKLKAAEIEVSVMDPKYFVDVRETDKDSVQKLEIGEVEKYLDAFDESDPGEIEEHPAAIDDLCNPLKKQRTSLLPETPVPSPGGSSNITETMD